MTISKRINAFAIGRSQRSASLVGVALLLTAVQLAFAAAASAETVLAQWNWNGVSLANIAVPTTGTGSYGGVNTTGSILTSTGPTGSLTDPLANSLGNHAALVGSFPALTDPSGTDGFRVTGVNTTGASRVQVGASLKVGRNASRYYQLQTTTDGTTWSPVSGGVGEITYIGTGDQAPAAVSISSGGLISFTANAAAYTNSNPSGYASFEYTLPSGQGFEDIATFGFRVLSVWDPAGSKYVAASPTGVYNNTGAGTAMLIDMVTVTAVPEPATWALIAGGLTGAALIRRRRHRS